MSEDIGESLEGSCEVQAQTSGVFVPFEADRAKVAEATVADHHEMRGVFFKFAEDMGRNDQGHAFALELDKQAREGLSGFGVESRGRFIKEEDFGVMDDGLSDGKALTEATREFASFLFEAVGKGETFGSLEQAFGDIAFLDSSDACGVVKALSDGELIIEAEKVREIAQSPLTGVGIDGGLDTFDLDMARKGLNKGGDAAHKRGFPCTVGADKSNDAAFLDGKADAKEDAACGVFEDQIFNGDQRTNLPCGGPSRSRYCGSGGRLGNLFCDGACHEAQPSMGGQG